MRLRVEVQQGWANIDVQLRRRYDLVPNLVETVKGYASHEKGVFEAVTEARTSAMSAHGPADAGASNNMLTKALGGQSMDFGVRVVAVNPGPVETDRMIKINKRRALDLYGDEARHVELRAKYPGGRPASPGEVADLIAFLASPRAGYISGSIVTIDGGIASRGSIIKEKS